MKKLTSLFIITTSFLMTSIGYANPVDWAISRLETDIKSSGHVFTSHFVNDLIPDTWFLVIITLLEATLLLSIPGIEKKIRKITWPIFVISLYITLVSSLLATFATMSTFLKLILVIAVIILPNFVWGVIKTAWNIAKNIWNADRISETTDNALSVLGAVFLTGLVINRAYDNPENFCIPAFICTAVNLSTISVLIYRWYKKRKVSLDSTNQVVEAIK